MSGSKRQQLPIAVVGVSALFPGSTDARGFWSDILEGKDLITDVPPTHWLVEDYFDPNPKAQDKTYSKRGGFLPTVDFDPLEYGVPPNIVPATDTAQLLALIVAQKVLDDAAQGQFSKLDRERISVLLGVTSAQALLGSMVSRLQKPVWLKALRESGIPEPEAQAICQRISDSYVPWQESSFPGLLGNVVAGRIANRFDLRGTNTVTDAACASSLAAVSMAVNELQLGQSDLVITGGVDAMNDIFMYLCFSKTPALSPTGDCRPFSDAADGTLLGEGIAMLALRRLDDAERDGDRIYAVIKGIGSSSDGRANSVYAPLPEGQARALRRAYEAAGHGPETVELVEAHGTGTKAGDVAEFSGLKLAFGNTSREGSPWCALGSVKSQIGHTKAAAGAAGLFKAVMALHHKVLPPTIKIDRPNPKLEVEKSPFYLNTQRRPWIRDASHPRRASVSSFGFGGSNFHVALEEYRPSAPAGKKAWRLRTSPTELVLLSASSPAQLLARCRELSAANAELSQLARQSQLSFQRSAPSRLAVVATNMEELKQKLEQAAASIEKAPGQAFSTPTAIHYATGNAHPGQVAFLFPGQGSQYVGMGADVAMGFDAARSAWDDAAALAFDGERLHEIVFPRPAFSDAERELQAKRLTGTEWAQPALGVQSQALSRLLRQLGIRPSCVAGHSFGELSALHEAGVLSAEALVHVARRRGELMRDASASPGAMCAVTSPLAQVRGVLEATGAAVVVANHNAPAQVVLSGATEEIAKIEDALSKKGMTARRLPVATAFHSPLVAGSSAPFLSFLEQVELSKPTLDVYGNADAAPYPSQPEEIRRRLASQLAQPVRFVDQIEAMYARGVRTFIEVGAGSVLTELVGRILEGREHLAVSLDRKGKHGVTALHEALGRLAIAGVEMDLSTLWADYAPPVEKPSKKAMMLSISGANHGSPYPPPGGAKALPPPNPPRQEQPSVEAIQRPAVPAASSATPPAATSTNASTEAHLAWVQAFQETQRQTTEAHAAYQRAMADTHMAFLKTAESAFAGLGVLLGGPAQTSSALGLNPPSLPVLPASPPPAAVPYAPPKPPEQAAVPSAPTAPVASSAVVDLEAMLLSVVAEKTGYPKEMLASHMELEADLGIDSIKRVEILSAMRERVPALPEVKPAEMATLRTLGQIVSHLGALGPANRAPAQPALQETKSASASVDLEALMLSIVAEKTGYPQEMLGSHMELEADLGIDSIKRVEILSTMRERAPGLPEVKPADMATLRTLGQIVAYLRQQSNAGATPVLPPAPATSRPDAVERFAVYEVSAPPVGMAMSGVLSARKLVLTDDGAGVAQAMAKKLSRHGVEATVSSVIPEDADAVVFLGGLRSIRSIDEAIAVNKEAFQVCRSVARRFSTDGGALVTVQDTGGDFGLAGADVLRAWLGGLSALARTAALEWPAAFVKTIDCERAGRSAEEIAEALVTELLVGGPALEVGLHSDGRRTMLVTTLTPTTALEQSRLGPESVIIASGGARGVTASCLISLARAKRPRIALLGRTALEEEPAQLRGLDEAGLKRLFLEQANAAGRTPTPAELSAQVSRVIANREIKCTLEALEAAGSKARYLPVDVQNAPALEAALASVRNEWGPITGIVHGAGVLADKLISEKTDAQFDRVFNTKVAGLRALLAATEKDPLELLCLFSSVAARAGNPGQADYAMANEVLNLVACAEQRRRGSSCVVRSIGWGPWEAGMVTPALKAHFQQQGVPLIPLETGTRMFVEELLNATNEVCTIVGGLKLKSARPPQASVEVHVDRLSHPHLGDHRIAGTPVLPVVLAVEWFLRAARACRPDLQCGAVKEIKVLRGIKLDGFATAGDRFVVTAKQLSNGTGAQLSVELRGHTGIPHYRAMVQMNETPSSPPPPEPSPALEQWSHPSVYDGHVLFHGPSFQAIRSVAGVSRQGIAGELFGTRELAWPQEPWRSDAAAFDGGLQLALLWSRHVLGKAVLPMALGEYRSYREGLTEGPVQCVVRGRNVHDARTLCDITFVDAAGSVVAEMIGVETVLRPDEAKATALLA